MYSIKSIAPEGGLSAYLLQLNQSHLLNNVLKPHAATLGFLQISQWPEEVKKHDKFYDVFGYRNKLFFDMVRTGEKVGRDTDITNIPKMRLKIKISGESGPFVTDSIVASVYYSQGGYDQLGMKTDLKRYARNYDWKKETEFLESSMNKFSGMSFSDKPKRD